MDPPQQPAELKRLAPVLSAASGTAARLHSAAFAAVPEKYKGNVQGMEDQVAAAASPYVALLSSQLVYVDGKVDSVILSAYATVQHTRAAVAQSGTASLEQLTAARQAYLKRVEESVAFVREAGLQGTAKVAADTLLSKVEDARKVPGVVLGEISDAWTKLAAMPAVERLLAASRGQVDAAFSRYMGVHNTLVADPRYASAVVRGSQLLASFQATSAFKAAAERFGPLLSPYAESAARVAAPYVAKAAAHMAPVAA